VASFGEQLRRERERRGITLDEISLSTKIGTRMLRALEDEHFEQLPGGIFNKGFVRAYARHLGLDEEQTISDYLAAIGGTRPGEQLQAATPAETVDAQDNAGEQDVRAARVPWGVLAIALLIVAFGFAIWGFYRREKSAEPLIVAPPSVKAKTVPEGPPATGVRASATTSAQPGHSDTSPAPAPVRPAESTASAAPAGVASPPASFTVVIKAREDSWLAITADGKEVMQDTLVAPAEKSVAAQKEVVVRAGNVGAVDFFFNGRKLPVQGDYDEVKTLTFDLNGLQPPAPKAQPPAEAPPHT